MALAWSGGVHSLRHAEWPLDVATKSLSYGAPDTYLRFVRNALAAVALVVSEFRRVMADYVRQQSVGELLKNGVDIYRRNFLAVFAIYFLVCFPLSWLQLEALRSGLDRLALAMVMLNLLVGSVAAGALTILVSDICLGNRISIGRSYSSLGVSRAAKILGTSLLSLLALLLGLLLLIVPGVVLYAAFVTIVPIVVLENRGGMAAIRRSWELSSGLRGRNLQVVLLVFALIFALAFVMGGITALFFPQLSERANSVLTLMIQFLLVPLLLVITVLLYYDSRVRHEGYDTSALGEDLHH
jgi:hypothetical protein